MATANTEGSMLAYRVNPWLAEAWHDFCDRHGIKQRKAAQAAFLLFMDLPAKARERELARVAELPEA